ncbi:hypothetical protein R3P38DRAFT_2784578 [Favolaschia claudopus]|uniref:Uncharacterized protein n=1 Tax=Favolaschia claudopus TaxID=2862362 RepID=A0AAW0AVS5_9AGAR
MPTLRSVAVTEMCNKVSIKIEGKSRWNELVDRKKSKAVLRLLGIERNAPPSEEVRVGINSHFEREALEEEYSIVFLARRSEHVKRKGGREEDIIRSRFDSEIPEPLRYLARLMQPRLLNRHKEWYTPGFDLSGAAITRGYCQNMVSYLPSFAEERKNRGFQSHLLFTIRYYETVPTVRNSDNCGCWDKGSLTIGRTRKFLKGESRRAGNYNCLPFQP